VATWTTVHEDYEKDWNWRLDRQQTNVSITQVKWLGNGRLTLTLLNVGATTLDPALVEVILDGIWRTDKITGRTVGAQTTNVWMPKEYLTLSFEGLSGNAQKIAVYTENGVGTYWR
jgi:archaellum component FlaF (FlaF/FlaG flagellin family)